MFAGEEEEREGRPAAGRDERGGDSCLEEEEGPGCEDREESARDEDDDEVVLVCLVLGAKEKRERTKSEK